MSGCPGPGSGKVTAATAAGRGHLRPPVHLDPDPGEHRVAGAAVRAAPARDGLGWDEQQITVIDEDLARSAATTDGRLGFTDLVAAVGLGKVGIIVGREVSRLARNNTDWYQVLDLCSITDTLIADADGIYHPGDFNDRLVLGLKGQMAEAELHMLRMRLTAALRHKAARGELRQLLPVGLDYDDGGKVMLSTDEAVRVGDRPGVCPVRPARVGPAGDDDAAGAGAAAAPPQGRLAADHLGGGVLSRGPRLPDQPGLCRRVRLRQDHHQDRDRRREEGHPAPASCRKTSGRC